MVELDSLTAQTSFELVKAPQHMTAQVPDKFAHDECLKKLLPRDLQALPTCGPSMKNRQGSPAFRGSLPDKSSRQATHKPGQGQHGRFTERLFQAHVC